MSSSVTSGSSIAVTATTSVVSTVVNPVTIVDIQGAINKIDILNSISKPGKNYKLDNVPRQYLDTLVQIAVDCCLNGPVGVGKKATFPGVQNETSIKDLWPDASNSIWKLFCMEVAKNMTVGSNVSCYTINKFNKLWPYCDDIYIPKVKK